MDILKYKGYEGTAELDMSAGLCRGKILFINDLVTYKSDAPSGLQAAFEEAVDDYLETCRDLNREPAKTFRGQFNVRVPPDLHRDLSLRAVEKSITLNELIVEALNSYMCVSQQINHNHFHLTGSPSETVTAASSQEAGTWRSAYVH